MHVFIHLLLDLKYIISWEGTQNSLAEPTTIPSSILYADVIVTRNSILYYYYPHYTTSVEQWHQHIKMKAGIVVGYERGT